MPIRKSERARYPRDWKKLSLTIRFVRAQGRCECTGQCGVDHTTERGRFRMEVRPSGDLSYVREPDPGFKRTLPKFAEWSAEVTRCSALHGQPAPVSGKPVVLTVAHLDHRPENNAPSNLLALCQRCHLRYDADLHRKQAAATRAARGLATGAPGTTDAQEEPRPSLPQEAQTAPPLDNGPAVRRGRRREPQDGTKNISSRKFRA